MLSRKYWNPALYSVLSEVLEKKNSSGIAVFDFDNTLIFGDHGINLMYDLILNVAFKGNENWFWNKQYWEDIPFESKQEIQELYQLAVHKKHIAISLLEKVLSVFSYLEAIDLEKAYRWSKIFFSGFHREELFRYSKMVFENTLQKSETILLSSGIVIEKKIQINPAFLELIRHLHNFQWSVYIITASPEIAIQSICDLWNIPPAHVIGMKLKEKNKILQPEIIEPYPYDKGKYLAIRSLVKKPIIIAAGDSYPDLFMLENAEIPIFVDRGKEELLTIAKKKNFYIQKFFLYDKK